MATLNHRAALTWVLAPATEQTPRSQAVAAAGLRILMGLLWLYNVSWKRAPDFGQDAGNGLYKFTKYAVDYPVFPPYSWVVEHLVLPNFAIFGWTVLLAETTLAVLLLTGAYVRLAALIGLAQAAAIGLSVAYAPAEWPWSYWMMIAAHAVLLFSSAGRVFGVDALRAGLEPARSLARPWGIITIALGLVSVLGSLGDPLAATGNGVRSTDLSISFGVFNLVGGLVLMIAGGLLVAGASARTPALAAVAVAGLGALSIEVQKGFSDPILGGDGTSAAVLISVAVVAGFVGRSHAVAATHVLTPSH